jgi:hypothetical protein
MSFQACSVLFPGRFFCVDFCVCRWRINRRHLEHVLPSTTEVLCHRQASDDRRGCSGTINGQTNVRISYSKIPVALSKMINLLINNFDSLNFKRFDFATRHDRVFTRADIMRREAVQSSSSIRSVRDCYQACIRTPSVPAGPLMKRGLPQLSRSFRAWAVVPKVVA